jgi:hypothetical protein
MISLILLHLQVHLILVVALSEVPVVGIAVAVALEEVALVLEEVVLILKRRLIQARQLGKVTLLITGR